MVDLMKNGQSWRNMIDYGVGSDCYKSGGTCRLLIWILHGVPLPSEIRMLFSSRYRESTSLIWGCYGLFQGEVWGRVGESGSEWPHCFFHFLRLFQLKYWVGKGTIFWGVLSWTHQPLLLSNLLLCRVFLYNFSLLAYSHCHTTSLSFYHFYTKLPSLLSNALSAL